MQSYQINELEKLTGIKAHTIRIWEKRYELITPHRTTTNRRYYDDEQVRKLLNVATLLSRGYKISKIAAFDNAAIDDHILGQVKHETQNNKKISYINDLIKAMLAFNERDFEEIFVAVVKTYGIYNAMLDIFYPFLHKTGILWSVNKTIPVQEHFASSIIRKKILAATDALDAANAGKKSFLLFLPPAEWHETGLLFANYLIRSAGFPSIYLGQNVPLENIDKITLAVSPQYLLLFYVATRPVKQIEAQLKSLSKANPHIQILVSGKPDFFTNIKSLGKNITYLPEVKSLLDFLK